MKNYEKYQTEIDEIINRGERVAIVNGRPMACASFSCNQCERYRNSCRESKLVEWLFSEYKAPYYIKINEVGFLSTFRQPELLYIARDENGELYLYLYKPTKSEFDTIWQGDSNGGVIALENSLFPFITWHDKSPWCVSDLLGLEVKHD